MLRGMIRETVTVERACPSNTRSVSVRPACRPPERRFRLLLPMLLLLAYGAALHLPYLGAWPLESHEALAAERTRELMTTGGWLVPHFAGKPDFRKPPVPFWIGGAFALLAGGVTEWSARLPSVLACLGTAVLLVLWVNRARGRRSALFAGFTFVTSGAAIMWARRAEADMQLCFWTTAVMLTYWFGLGEPVRRRQVLLAVAMWLSLAVGVLTKGPLPLAFLGLAVVATVAFDPNRRRRLRRLLPVAGPLLLVAALTPWVLTVVQRHPEALATWYGQSLGRYAGELGHEKPFYFYAARAPLLWLPWILPLGLGLYLAVRRSALSRPAWGFLLVWGLGGLVFLSFSVGKRLHYALPAVPPVMVFAGLGLEALMRPPQPLTRPWRWGVVLHGALVPMALAAGLAAAAWLPEYRLALAVLGALAALGLGLSLFLYIRGRPAGALAGLALSLLVVLTIGYREVVGPLLTQANTEAAICRYIAQRAPEQQEAVACYGEVGPQVLFYAGQAIPVLGSEADVAAWREHAPEGLLVTRSGPWRAKVERVGPWREILPGSTLNRFASREVVLLQAVDPLRLHVPGVGPTRAQRQEVPDE